MAKKGRGIDFPPQNKPAAESFDPTAVKRDVEHTHFVLVEKLKSLGVRPEDIPRAWEGLDKTVLQLGQAIEKYTTSRPKDKEVLAKQIRRLEKNVSGHIAPLIEKTAIEYLKVKGETQPVAAAVASAPEAVSPKAEPVPPAEVPVVEPLPEPAPVVAPPPVEEPAAPAPAPETAASAPEETPAPEAKEPEPETVPPELKEIFGDRKVRRSVLETFAKLRDADKRKSYLETLQKEEAGRQKEAAIGRDVGAHMDALLSDPESLKKLSTEKAEEPITASPAPEAPTTEGGALSAVPPELKEIYGDRVPPQRALEMFAKLKGKEKRDGYLATLRADEAERRAREERREERRKVPKPEPTPRKRKEEPRGPDVDERNLVSPFKPSPEMQAGMDKLASRVDTRTAAERLAEAEAGLRFMKSGVFGAKPEPLESAVSVEAPQPQEEPVLGHGELGAMPEGHQIGSAPFSESDAYAELEPADEQLRAFREKEAEEQREIDERIKTMRAIGEKLHAETELSRPAAAKKAQEESPASAAREFHADGSEYIDFEEMPPKPDGTQDWRARWRGKLNETIGKVVGGADAAKEKISGLFEKSKEFLKNADTTFAEKAKTLGKATEKLLLDIGESYRKTPLKYKIALSAALIGGSIATGGASTFVTVLSAAKLGQRSASSLGVYTLVNGLMEKRLASREEKGIERSTWDNAVKQFVSGGAALAVFSGLPGLALKEGFEAAGGGRLVEWLGGMLGHHAVELPKGPTASGTIHTTPVIPEAPNPAAAAAAGEVAATASMPGMPVVGASTHGYEGMLKDLINKLPDKPPAGLKPESDLAKLFEAKAHPETIGTKIHLMAMDHKFFAEKGDFRGNFRVDTGAHMTVDTHGNVRFNGMIDAPAGAPMIPEPHAATAPAAAPEIVSPPPVAPGPDLTAAQEVAEQKLAAANAIAPEAAPVPEHPAAAPAPEQGYLTDTSGNKVLDSQGNPVHSGSFEAPVGANAFGIVVPESAPHIYADPTESHLFIYGGSPAERTKTIFEYLVRNPNKVIFAADDTGKYRIPWHLVDGKAVAGPPLRNSGVFGMFSTWVKPPAPDDFAKIIK